MVSTGRILVAIVHICFEAKNWTALNEHITMLTKRRSQLKGAVVKMIQECVTYVDKTPNKEIKVKLIETLRTVTEGKVSMKDISRQGNVGTSTVVVGFISLYAVMEVLRMALKSIGKLREMKNGME